LGLLNRPGKPSGPDYLAHTSLDTKNGIIVDVHPSAGNINDCEPFIERLKVIQEKFELDIKNVGTDRCYDTTPIHHGLKTLEISFSLAPHKCRELICDIEFSPYEKWGEDIGRKYN
jgi:hypothetical protein